MYYKFEVRQFSKIAQTVFIISLLVACSGKVEEEKAAENGSADVEVSASLFEKGFQKLTPWTSYWASLGMSKGQSAFNLTSTLKIEPLERPEVNPIKKGEHPLASFQFHHPTNEGTVDIYHYKIHVGDGLDVSFEPDADLTITDHGEIVDQDGRAARMIMSLAADDKGRVYIYGSWHVKTFNEATLQYLLFDYPGGDLYKLMKRGEFFAVFRTTGK